MIKTGRREDFEHVSVQLSRTINRVLTRHFGPFHASEAWSPNVNVYQRDAGFDVCVDLAGVAPESVEVHVTAKQLSIRGLREAPDPRPRGNEPMRIIVMEIDHGPFCRTIELPERIDYANVRTEYARGLLCIRLPLRMQG